MKTLEDVKTNGVIYDRIGMEHSTLAQQRDEAFSPMSDTKRHYKVLNPWDIAESNVKKGRLLSVSIRPQNALDKVKST